MRLGEVEGTNSSRTMSPRPAITTLLASLAFAAAAAPAAASPLPLPVPASASAYDAAHAVAVAHWGTDPCGGRVAIGWSSLDATVNAVATWSNPMSLYGHAALDYGCSITYNLHQPWTWPMFCTITEHELGHLAGQQHVDDPANVMSPYYTGPSPECLAAPAPAGGPATVSARSRLAARARARRARAASRRYRPHLRFKTA